MNPKYAEELIHYTLVDCGLQIGLTGIAMLFITLCFLGLQFMVRKEDNHTRGFVLVLSLFFYIVFCVAGCGITYEAGSKMYKAYYCPNVFIEEQ